MEQAAAAHVVDPDRPLRLLHRPDPQHVAHQEPLRAGGVVLERRRRQHAIVRHERRDRRQRVGAERAVPFGVAVRAPRPLGAERPPERRRGLLERRDRDRLGDCCLQVGSVAVGLGDRELGRRADRLGGLGVAAAGDRHPDRVAADPLHVWAAKQRRLFGRDALADQLRGDLPEEHRRQPRPALAGRAPCIGDDEALARRFAREREPQLLLAATVRARREPSAGALGDLGPLVVEQDRILPRRRRERPLGRAEDPQPAELDPRQRVDRDDVHAATRERPWLGRRARPPSAASRAHGERRRGSDRTRPPPRAR